MGISIEKQTRVLELVHTDVCGPFNSVNREGKRHYVSFLDDFTHTSCVYFINYKSEVVDKFIEYERSACNQIGQNIKHLRCDNGTEYIMKHF